MAALSAVLLGAPWAGLAVRGHRRAGMLGAVCGGDSGGD